VKTLFDERYIDNFTDDLFYVDKDDQLIMIFYGSGKQVVYYTCGGQKAIDDWIRRGIVRHEGAV